MVFDKNFIYVVQVLHSNPLLSIYFLLHSLSAAHLVSAAPRVHRSLHCLLNLLRRLSDSQLTFGPFPFTTLVTRLLYLLMIFYSLWKTKCNQSRICYQSGVWFPHWINWSKVALIALNDIARAVPFPADIPVV